MLSVKPNWKLSPNDIEALNKDGHGICMTPHIGNKWRADLAAALYGVELAMLEVNCSTKDTLDCPGQLQLWGQSHTLSTQANTMSPYLDLDADAFVDEFGSYGNTPAAIHQVSTMICLGDNRDKVTTSAEYTLFRHQKIIDYLYTLLSAGEIIFDRTVTNDGKVHKGGVNYSDYSGLIEQYMMLKRHQVSSIDKGKVANIGGPVMSNVVGTLTICLNSILDQLEAGIIKPGSKSVQTYTVSGPAMINYATGNSFQMELSKLYDILADKHPELPKKVVFNMIPGAILEFLPYEREGEREDLFLLTCDALANANEMGPKIGAFIKDASSKGFLTDDEKAKKWQMVTAKQGFQSKVTGYINELKDLGPTPRISQYDLLKLGRSISFPDSLKSLTFQQIKKVFGSLLQN